MRKRKSYYWVFALKDGTIWLAIQKRKSVGRLRIDEDGIWNWMIEKVDEEREFTPTAKIVRGATIATCLNMKRLLREQVERRLDRLEGQMANISEKIDRIECALSTFNRGPTGEAPEIANRPSP